MCGYCYQRACTVVHVHSAYLNLLLQALVPLLKLLGLHLHVYSAATRMSRMDALFSNFQALLCPTQELGNEAIMSGVLTSHSL